MSTESHELILYLDNDEPLWRMKSAIFRALAKKKERGVFDSRLAPKAFTALLTRSAKKYVREFGSPGDRWNLIFSPIDRRQAALELAAVRGLVRGRLQGDTLARPSAAVLRLDRARGRG